MKIVKSIRRHDIPIEVWKCAGKRGLVWLAKIFNYILNQKHAGWMEKKYLDDYIKKKGDI